MSFLGLLGHSQPDRQICHAGFQPEQSYIPAASIIWETIELSKADWQGRKVRRGIGWYPTATGLTGQDDSSPRPHKHQPESG